MLIGPFLITGLPIAIDIVKGIADGSMTLKNGIILVAKGFPSAGEIIGILNLDENNDQQLNEIKTIIEANSQKLDALGAQVAAINSLQFANLALSGLNLAVSVAGFAIVCKKLNNISNTLQEHSAKLNKILAGIDRLEKRNELNDKAKLSSLLASTQEFFHTQDHTNLRASTSAYNEQYEFNLLLLEDLSKLITHDQFFDYEAELKLFRERLLYLGLGKAAVWHYLGEDELAFKTLEKLNDDLFTSNKTVYDKLTGNKQFLAKATTSEIEAIKQFFAFRAERLPAIEYQMHLFKLMAKEPLLRDVIAQPKQAHQLIICHPDYIH